MKMHFPQLLMGALSLKCRWGANQGASVLCGRNARFGTSGHAWQGNTALLAGSRHIGM
jgi:hypothetical protein